MGLEQSLAEALLVRDHSAGQGSHCMVLWRGKELLKARDMMDLLFVLARVGLLTKHRGDVKLINKLKHCF